MTANKIEGVGFCLRAEHFSDLLALKEKKINWFEVLADNYLHQAGIAWDKLIEIVSEIPSVLHCVNLGLGNTQAINWDYCEKIKNIAWHLKSQWISDHFCWTSLEKFHSHALLPLLFDESVVMHVSDRIKRLQDYFQLPLIVENIASYLHSPDNTYEEVDFINEIAHRADCGILLDISNLYVNANNQGYCPKDFIKRLAADRVFQFHLAGYEKKDSLLIDTHDKKIDPEVWALFEIAVKHIGTRPACIEWDSNIPSFHELHSEAKKLACYV